MSTSFPAMVDDTKKPRGTHQKNTLYTKKTEGWLVVWLEHQFYFPTKILGISVIIPIDSYFSGSGVQKPPTRGSGTFRWTLWTLSPRCHRLSQASPNPLSELWRLKWGYPQGVPPVIIHFSLIDGIWLVVWNIFYFPINIGFLIIPID